MKNILSSFLLLAALLISQRAQSQKMNRFPRIHDRIVTAKLNEIKQRLQLDQATFDQFRPIYVRYDDEIASMDFSKMARLMRVETDSLTAEEADELVKNQLVSARKLIDIRENYYREFKKVLKPQQIIKLYQIEAELRKKVMEEIKRRMISR